MQENKIEYNKKFFNDLFLRQKVERFDDRTTGMSQSDVQLLCELFTLREIVRIGEFSSNDIALILSNANWCKELKSMIKDIPSILNDLYEHDLKFIFKKIQNAKNNVVAL